MAKKAKAWKPYSRSAGVLARQLHTRTTLDGPDGTIAGNEGDFLVAFPPVAPDEPWRYDIWDRETFKDEFKAVKGGKVAAKQAKELREQLKLTLNEETTGGPSA